MRHASRTGEICRKVELASGERESTKQVTYPGHRDSPPKGGVIPGDAPRRMTRCQRAGIPTCRDLSVWERPAPYQLVGEVMAHQGDDA